MVDRCNLPDGYDVNTYDLFKEYLLKYCMVMNV